MLSKFLREEEYGVFEGSDEADNRYTKPFKAEDGTLYLTNGHILVRLPPDLAGETKSIEPKLRKAMDKTLAKEPETLIRLNPEYLHAVTGVVLSYCTLNGIDPALAGMFLGVSGKHDLMTFQISDLRLALMPMKQEEEGENG
jgi:hypothetical protein